MERREAEQGVLSFLKSKGYLSACNALKADARISTAIECAPRLEHIFSVALTATVPNNYFENYQHLQAWADRTLPKYRQDLQRLLFPAFAYLYLEMVRHSLPEARDFFLRFSGEHTYKEDLALLETLSSARKLDSDTGRLFLENMMRVKISKCALQLLMSFIESEGFSLMYWVMSKYVDFEVTAEASGSKAVLLDKRDVFVHPLEYVKTWNDSAVKLVTLDLRSKAEFDAFHLDSAQRVTFAQLADKDFVFELDQLPPQGVVVLVTNDEAEAVRAWQRLKVQGVTNLYILEHGLRDWQPLFSHVASLHFDLSKPPAKVLEQFPKDAFTTKIKLKTSRRAAGLCS